MQYTSKLPKLETTIFTVMSALANKHNAINLSQGFPNFDSDPKLIDLVAKAMKSGHNQYAPMLGALELRKAIAGKFELLYESSYNPENEIVITAGASQAIFSAICAFVKEGDEVILFRPAYDIYEPAVNLNGGKVISVQLKRPNYEIDWEEVEQRISSKTRMIITNTPHNPAGSVITIADMLKLEELTNGTDIIVLSDEVYEHIIFDGEKHQSACLFSNLKERTLITASFGKTFHNTGWKTGYCCGPKDLLVEVVKVHQFSVFSVNHPVQLALAEYIKTPENYMYLSEFYQEKRDLFLDLIKSSRFKYSPSKGTYFQLLDFSEITDENDVDFAIRLTRDHRIATIPISVFNQNKEDHKMLRVCFAKTKETLKHSSEILCSI